MRRALTMLLLIAALLPAAAQNNRKVTPVDNDEKKPPQPTLHYYDKHGNALAEPVLFLADLDTVKAPGAKPKYPLLYALDFGMNVFDGVMRLTGQKYSSFDISATLNLHNWVLPALEAGAGFAKNTPEDNNYTYRGKLSPYFKLGADYNFLYKSDPAYRVFVGLRLGFSHYRYDIDGITISSPYWDETQRFSITGQKGSMLWGEVLAGLKVKIAGGFSLSWTVRYHVRMKEWNETYTRPWFVPGYGRRTGPVSATFSLIWTIPLAPKEPPTAADAPDGNSPE